MYLVQRMELRKIIEQSELPFIDDFFSMDYMGSAEFEGGSLSQSLKRVCSSLSEYNVKKLDGLRDADGLAVWLFSKCDDMSLLEKHVRKLAEDEYALRLKEYTRFKSTLKKKEDSYRVFSAWWDIDVDNFFVIGKPTMDKLQIALKNLRTKWVKAGKIK